MQNETSIILFGLLVGWLLTSFYFFKAMKRVNRRSSDDLKQYQADLYEAKQRYLALYRQTLSFGTFLTREDAHVLLNTADSLRLAQETWKAFPGTELVNAKAYAQQIQIKKLADRALSTLSVADKLRTDFNRKELSLGRGAA
ncbi:hypothetical protein [Pseudomonas sp. H3_D04]